MNWRVGRNASVNALGVVAPAVCGVLAMPVLIDNLGAQRIGVFALILGFYGFVGFFDLGLSRALTQSVAAADGCNDARRQISALTRKATIASLLLACLWAMLFFLAAEPLVAHVFRVDDTLREEARRAIQWFAVSLPLLLLSGVGAGLLEGLQLFGRVNLLRIPVSVAAIIAPAAASHLSPALDTVLIVTVAVRAIALVLWLLLAHRSLNEVEDRQDRGTPVRGGHSLWRFSAWLSVSNVVGPIIVMADRYFLAMIYPMQKIAYYTVPLDTLLRGMGVPAAAANALFPAIARAGVDSSETSALLRGAVLVIGVLWGLPLLLLGNFLELVLHIWLGEEFAANSLILSQWLLLGVMVNGFAHIPYALLHAAGRSDTTARLHLIQLPIYALLLWLFVSWRGLEGAAIAWSLRILSDAMMLYLVVLTRFRVPSAVMHVSLLVPALMVGMYGLSVFE